MTDRIKKLRKVLELTQQEFADKLNIKRNTIANYETGRNQPIDAVVSLICKTFNVSEVWLRTGEGEMFLPVSRSDEIASFAEKILRDESDSFRRRFISMLSRLDESDWAVLERMALDMFVEKEKYIVAEAEKSPETPTPKRSYVPIAENQIDAEVEAYRLELLAEAKGKTSLASDGASMHEKNA